MVTLNAFESGCKVRIQKHFPQSAIGGSKYGANEVFDNWMLSTLDEAEADLKAGMSMADVLQKVADSRRAFEEKKGNNKLKAGVLRPEDSDYYPGVLGSNRDLSLADDNNSPARIALMQKLAPLMEQREPPITKDEYGSLWQNHYTMRDGRKIESSKAGKDAWEVRTEAGDFPGENLHYDAAHGKNMRVILEDSLARLEDVRKNGASLKSEEEYLRAAYGFFTAMPYHKGSASIGRVMFTGVANQVFKKASIDPDMDGYALMLNEEQFIAHFRKEMFGRD